MSLTIDLYAHYNHRDLHRHLDIWTQRQICALLRLFLYPSVVLPCWQTSTFSPHLPLHVWQEGFCLWLLVSCLLVFGLLVSFCLVWSLSVVRPSALNLSVSAIDSVSQAVLHGVPFKGLQALRLMLLRAKKGSGEPQK